MWKEILITDVTQMREGRVCVAGLDTQLDCIRLEIPPTGVAYENLFQDEDVIIRPRAVVKVFAEPLVCIPPHIEDHHWSQIEAVEFLRYTPSDKWQKVLEKTARTSLNEIFGYPIHLGKNIPQGIEGTCSLGTLKAAIIEDFYIRDRDDGALQYRTVFQDRSGETFDVPINDLSFLSYVEWRVKQGDNHEAILGELLTQFQCYPLWLRVGLTRPFQGWCWVQVTGFYSQPDYLAGRCFIGMS